MSIPLNFNPLGFTQVSVPAEPSELPEGYTRLAFLEADSSAAIDTGVNAADTTLGYWCRIQQTAPESGSHMYYCGAQVSASYRILRVAGTGYKLAFQAGLINGNIITPDIGVYDIAEAKFNYKNDGAVYCNGVHYGDDTKIRPESEISFGLFRTRYNSTWDPANGLRIYFFVLTVEEETVRDYLPAIDPQGVPCMFDLANSTPYYNALSGTFTAGIETLDQLTALASNLPTVTDTPEIKLSLPGEWNGDASANAQLSIITGKGWSTTITYRDVETSTSSSFVLGNRGDGGSALVLWCRAVESEHGNYQDADGVLYYVETCHDIWHPAELSPDDLGYTAVLTLEDYLTERGLTAVVYEEDELFTTN